MLDCNLVKNIKDFTTVKRKEEKRKKVIVNHLERKPQASTPINRSHSLF